jgi:predicted NACHT family NTPase
VTSRVVGYRPRVLRDAGFVRYTVQDFGPDKIDAFLCSWYDLALHDRAGAAEMRRERLTRAIKDSAPIRELAGNPLLLTILAIIGKHQELPRERWKVYDHAAGVLVQHWDVNKHLVDENIDADVIREDDKKELLRKLAIRMQEGSHGFAGTRLVEKDLFQDIESYLLERFRYEPAKAAAISTAMVKQLRERNFIFARHGSGVYGFIHRALLEFFSASDIVNRFEKARTLSEDELVDQVFVPHSEDPAWAEVLRLIAGMVDATVATRLVDRLLASTGLIAPRRWTGDRSRRWRWLRSASPRSAT